MPNADPYGGSFTIPDQLHVDRISFDGDLVTIHASTEGPASECPLCERPSRRLHGSYTRTLADLPWCGVPVRLRVRIRKFICDEPSCERLIFAERLENIADVYARGTDRRREALEWIAFALGGEAGARLARELGLLVSPDALQIADRWHLLRSLGLGLEEFLLRNRSALGRAAAPETDEREEPLPGSIDGDVSTVSVRLGRPYGSIEGPAQRRHERLVEIWKDIRRLHLAGARVKDIAEWVGTSQSTVYRYRERTEPPPRPSYGRRASVLDPYFPYLLARWNEGCRSARRLHQEIRDQGYRHSVDTVNRLLSSFRYTEGQGQKLPLAPRAKTGSIAGASPTAKNVAALFMRREEMLNAEQKEYLERLCASDGALAVARRLTQEFAEMVRNLEGEKLDGWLEEAEASGASVMEKFATGLRKDHRAVRAGLTEEWSNGPVEGFITKLKLIKRQGYGRANFDLLRARTLAA